MKGPWLKSALKQNDPEKKMTKTVKPANKPIDPKVASALSAGAIVPAAGGGTGSSTAATIPVVGTRVKPSEK